jgi:hypothetical protein
MAWVKVIVVPKLQLAVQANNNGKPTIEYALLSSSCDEMYTCVVSELLVCSMLTGGKEQNSDDKMFKLCFYSSRSLQKHSSIQLLSTEAGTCDDDVITTFIKPLFSISFPQQ